MLVQHLHQPFEIELIVSDDCPVKPHRHTFFELVYILDGRGSYVINGQRHTYGKDDTLVIIPEQGHHTIVQDTTTFVFIRFSSNSFLTTSSASAVDTEWMARMEHIFFHQQKLQDKSGDKTKTLLRILVTRIIQESERKHFTDTALVNQLIKTLLMIIIKEIDDPGLPSIIRNKSALQLIMDYIQSNIREPNKLKLERIANHVHMSKNYVSEYFRKHSSTSLQQYIQEYKLRLVEERLLASDLSLSEIAFEFGFSGESHLATAFKKYRGVSPVRFRKQSLALCAGTGVNGSRLRLVNS